MRFDLGAAVNDGEVLASNLLTSSLLSDGDVQHLFVESAQSASEAYNTVLRKAISPYIILAHQDVYLPGEFKTQLSAAICAVEETSKDWAVLGVVGIDSSYTLRGRVWSNGLQREVGTRVERLTAVESIDELLIIIRRDSGLCFDEGLPGFHLYGTDIVLTALESGLSAYVFDGPVIHNSLPVRCLKSDYKAAYCYMQQKWRHRLPLKSLVTPITRTLWPLRFQQMRALKRKVSGSQYVMQRHPDSARLARELGYESPGVRA